ncbi:hypothetical protein LINGRAHAP2_LOCUS19241 [Linum grandiflorum]
MEHLQMPPSVSMAEFPADMVYTARTLIDETRNRLSPKKYKRFSDNLMYLARRAASKLPDHTSMLVVDMLDGQPDLIEKFNAFLPEEKHRVRIERKSPPLPPSTPPELGVPRACAEAADFVNKLWRRDKKLMRSVSEVFESCNRGEIDKDDVFGKVVELLKGEPHLLKEFASFLPVTVATPISAIPYVMEEGEVRDSEAEEQRNPKKRAKPSENSPNYNYEILNSEEQRNPAKRAKSSENSPNYNYEILNSEEQRNPAKRAKSSENSPNYNYEIEEHRNPEKRAKSSENSPNNYEIEEHRNPEKRAKSSENSPNNYEILGNKIPNSALDNPEEQVTLCSPSLYRYAKGHKINPANLSVKFQTIRYEKKQGSEKLGCSSRGRVSTETMKNKIEEDRHNLDLVEEYLNSATGYLERKEEERGYYHPLGQIHLRCCVEAMYDLTEQMLARAMGNPEFLSRFVKKRLHQKIEELQGVRERLTEIWAEAEAELEHRRK